MSFTDLFIRRPVLATVVSLMIALLGLQAFNQLPVRQYPSLESATVRVTTSYPGASAELIQGFITTPVQQVIASAEGIDYLTSSSSQNSSEVTAHLRLGYNADQALIEIMSKVNQVRSQLPESAEDPIITKADDSDSALLYLSFNSPKMNSQQVTDYLVRVVQPQFSTIEGVASADIFGAKYFAMRVWLDPVRMAAFKVTASDVNQALLNSNVQSAAGQTKGELVITDINAHTGLTTAKDFSRIVIRRNGDQLVRMEDVADVELGPDNFDSFVALSGKPSTYLGISPTPSANPLEVIKRVRKKFPDIQSQLPAGMNAEIVYDATQFIQESIDEVTKTLFEATLIVIIVVFLFLGSLRIVIIPVIAIPLSMIGVLFVMQLMGYSINLLTLLAMVLAIGLVVDDAIVVVENIHRHIEEGKSPFDAALLGAREIALPVIAMTITLAAVYTPIGFMEGLTGSLFKEFAFTLAGAVVVSGIVALTLSPMMCSRLLLPSGDDSGFTQWLDQKFEHLKAGYSNRLKSALSTRQVTLVFALIVLATIPPMFLMTKKELAPTEDNGLVFIVSKAPEYANLDYINKYTSEMEQYFRKFPEYKQSFLINTTSSSFTGMVLQPWSQRDRSAFQVQTELQNKYLPQVAGMKTFSFIIPSLPGSGGGMPVEFVLNTTSDYKTLSMIASELVERAMKSGMFMFADSTLTFNKPETEVLIDRDKATSLGISMQDISTTFSTMLGSGTLNRFSIDGRSYKVIPQASREFRMSREWLGRYYVRSASGQLVPLSSIISLKTETRPSELTQFQQLNSTTIKGMLKPGVSLGEALAFLRQQTAEIAPKGFGTDYKGTSRQFMHEGNALIRTFIISLLVIFLVLSAQFESFRDPLIVMLTVPMSICGALIPLVLGDLFQFGLGINVSMNIYTQIGLVTLIGLISKHGILIVEFANKLQERGMNRKEAILEASALRLRPILMTTGATVLGIAPLLFATGAGAISRFNIGLVITSGMTIGTLFTLFVIPVMYSYLARDRMSGETTQASGV